MIREIQEHVYLVVGIVRDDAFQISQVHAVHDDQVIIFLIICPGDLAGMVAVAGDAVFGKLSSGRRIDRIADFLCAGGRGGDVEIGGLVYFGDHVF